MSIARDNILRRISVALENKTTVPFPDEPLPPSLFGERSIDLTARFEEEMSTLNGKVIRCKDQAQVWIAFSQLIAEKKWSTFQCSIPSLALLIKQHEYSLLTHQNHSTLEVGITGCECLIARTGTIMLSSAMPSGRVLPIYAPIHIVIASVDTIVWDIEDALQFLRNKYLSKLPSAFFFASGPSRTADIEKKLIMGVHGPKEVYVFLIENP